MPFIEEKAAPVIHVRQWFGQATVLLLRSLRMGTAAERPFILDQNGFRGGRCLARGEITS